MTIGADADMLDEAAQALRVAREVFDSFKDDPARQRLACTTALMAALRLLHALPLPKPDLLPLDRLLSALVDVGRGCSDPLLTPTQKHGGQPLSTEQLFVQATSVSLMEFLVLSGWSEKEAKQRVAAALARHGMVSGRRKQPITASMIHNWRSKGASGDAPAMARAIDEQLADLRSITEALGYGWPMKREAAEQVLRMLPAAIWPRGSSALF